MSKLIEEWCPIKEYEGLYEVSDWGNVRSIKRNNKILRPRNVGGYLQLVLYKNGLKTPKYIHRLVAEAFIPNPDNLPQVNHIDEDTTNNALCNIEWCTADYNTNYGNRNNKVSKKLFNGKLSKPAYQYTLNGELVKIWPSVSEAARNGFNHTSISRCCNGKIKNYKNYKWSYNNV